ncbi:MAG: hypothetical protein JWP64_4032 [Pseudonocardia sp.]|jgi:hypothetical protein|uniref:hypothetical protein n=1 Tax=Pseudonocardia sp. TaxID=60912 RepID=UPI00260AD97F|nr:hypothetical protein [Pseudonocardia sp.]MCU1629083.1 hypothetical protein [Pseudonocardia sp.]
MVLLVLVLPVLMGVFMLVMERLEAALLGGTPPDLDEELPVQDGRRQNDLGRLSPGKQEAASHRRQDDHPAATAATVGTGG